MTDQVPNIQAPSPVSDLDDLAKQIEVALVEVGVALLTSVQRAAEVGHLLAQAKEQVDHGQWLTWVEQNTTIAPRTARMYMQIERDWGEADAAKRRRVADLGLRGFLREIAESRPTPVDEPADSTPSPSWMRGAVKRPDLTGMVKNLAGSIERRRSEDPERAEPPASSGRWGGYSAGSDEGLGEVSESYGLRSTEYDLTRRAENLAVAKQAYGKLDTAGRHEFQKWVEKNPNRPEIIDLVAT